MIGVDSDEEFDRQLKLAVEQYKKNRQPERNKNSKKNEVVQARNKLPNELKEGVKFLKGIADIPGEKMKSYLKEYEKQGAIPKRINYEMKSNQMLVRDHSNGEEKKRTKSRGNSQSQSVRSHSVGRNFDTKSSSRERNSGLNKMVLSSNTSNTKVKAPEKFLESFYYIVPEEPSPDFVLLPGTYYVVSKPLDLSNQTALVVHPPRSNNHLLKNSSKSKHHRKSLEQFVVCLENVNDLNKSQRNCSNVTLARELIAEYNSGCSKVDVLKKLKMVKADLEVEIEGFKSALTESTLALDQLKIMELSINYKVSQDKEFDNKENSIEENFSGLEKRKDLGNKEISMEEDIKGKESYEEDGAQVGPLAENYSVNKGGDEGGSDLMLLENSPEDNKGLTAAQEEKTVEDSLMSGDQSAEIEEYSEEMLLEEMINSRIVNITSILPDIDENYLRTELLKIGDDEASINIFTNDLIENQKYTKRNLDPDENERKRLWKEYVTDFNPKKFLFELSTVSPKDAADNVDIDLVMAFLKRRYPRVRLEDLRCTYEMSKNIAEVCQTYDKTVTPVRLSESGFWEEKFEKKFLLKIIHLDFEQEIDDYLSKIKKKKELEREEAELYNAFLNCLTCYDNIVPCETTTCAEGHIFCTTCVEQYIKVELGKGIYEFKCFSENCDAFFSQKTLEELLPASVLMKISRKQQAEEIMKAEVDGLESCSFCDFAYVPDSDDKIFKCRNPACMAEICRQCGERSHIPLRCNEIERPKDVEARKKIEEVMTNALIRTCPSCRKKVVKIDGCNKMTCTCGTLFCYLCQNRISGYSHFGPICPLHTNNAELHGQRVIQAGIRARDELLGEDFGVRIVHDPTKGFYQSA